MEKGYVDNPMRIAFIVGEFPSLSETFIVNQITGLLEAGHEVAIFAHRRRNEGKIHPDVTKYELEKRCSYHHMPKNKMYRIIKALGVAVTNPKLIKTFNVRR